MSSMLKKTLESFHRGDRGHTPKQRPSFFVMPGLRNDVFYNTDEFKWIPGKLRHPDNRFRNELLENQGRV
jgi:hypothetical protein